MGRHQTASGGEYGPLAIALDAAPFEYEIQMVFVDAFHQAFVVEVAINLIVESRLELLAPAVEAEIKQYQMAIFFDGNKSVVACPCVVVGNIINHKNGFELLNCSFHLLINSRNLR